MIFFSLGRASRLRCQLHRKRESQRDVSDCKTSRNRLLCLLRPARHTCRASSLWRESIADRNSAEFGRDIS
jgi:hypothetical protein